MNLVIKVKKFIDDNNLISKGDSIVIGVSGGPDSLCLLNVLYSLKDEYNLTLIVAHVNHNLRKEAKFEADFVEKVASNLGLKFFLADVDIEKMVKEQKKSCEEVAREYRYNFFTRVLKENSADKIAVAHNLNDNAETILMNIIRGTGAYGLKGIRDKNNNIIRPLLNTSREEIEKYCHENNLTPMIDKTNFETLYTRNKIRNKILPLICEINPDALSSITRLGNILDEEDEFISEYIDKIYREIIIASKNIKIDKNKFLTLHKGIQRRVLRKAILEFRGDLIDITYKSLENAISTINTAQNGSIIKVARDVKIFVNYDVLEFFDKIEKNIEFEYELNVPGKTYIRELDIMINAEVKNAGEVEDFTKISTKKFFDIEKTGKKLYVRNRRFGDSFLPNGLNGTKKLKDFFSDLKIPTYERDRIPILTNKNDIIWVMGFRTSKKFLKDKNTKEVIILDYGKNI